MWRWPMFQAPLFSFFSLISLTFSMHLICVEFVIGLVDLIKIWWPRDQRAYQDIGRSDQDMVA
uniref:Uncharacterized protein n=1 Tax=Arundo donax TaxID=35708 RepID=A0A0A9GV53_ARUDO